MDCASVLGLMLNHSMVPRLVMVPVPRVPLPQRAQDGAGGGVPRAAERRVVVGQELEAAVVVGDHAEGLRAKGSGVELQIV